MNNEKQTTVIFNVTRPEQLKAINDLLKEYGTNSYTKSIAGSSVILDEVKKVGGNASVQVTFSPKGVIDQGYNTADKGEWFIREKYATFVVGSNAAVMSGALVTDSMGNSYPVVVAEKSTKVGDFEFANSTIRMVGALVLGDEVDICTIPGELYKVTVRKATTRIGCRTFPNEIIAQIIALVNKK